MRYASRLRSLAHPLERRVLMAVDMLTAVADGYVRDGSFAGSNFGTSADLVVKRSGTDFNREALLRFDLAGVGANVTSATLRVYGSLQDNRQLNVPTDVYGTAATWSESGVTWNNRPAPTTAKLATFNVVNAAATWYEVDLTAFIRAEKAAGRNAVAVVLRNPASATPYTLFRSREATNKPALVVDSEAGTTPTPTPTPTPTGTPVTFTAAADTSARDGSYAGNNFGTATELVVKRSGGGFNRETFLKFDLSGVAGSVTGATLRVFGKLQNNNAANVATDVYGTGSTWAESTLNWNNRPAATTAKLGSAVVKNATGQWYEVDVTSYLNAELAAGRKVVSLLLRNPVTADPYTGFNSREVATNKPQIVVTAAMPTPTPTPTPTLTQTPYEGTAGAVPGLIEAERFDDGGEGVAYHDVDPANQGGSFRTGVGVDIEPSNDAGGGFAIGHVVAGEWLEYTIDVATSAAYDLGVRFASGGGGGVAHLEVDGVNVSGAITLPGTGGWANWQTITKPGLSLPGGRHVIRFSFDSSAQGGDIGNLNWLQLTRSPAPAQPPRWPASWQTAAPALTPRFEAAGTVVGGKIFVFGGFKSDFTVHRTHASYDTATNTWADLGTMPATMAESHQALAADDRYVYIAGGFGGNLDTTTKPVQWISDKVWRYDAVANTFTQIATLPQARGAGTMDLLGRELHYIAGNPADRVTNVGDHFVYNLDTGAWRTAAPLPNPKDHLSSVVLNGKIYALGGEHGHDEAHLQMPDMHVYDPAADAWTKLADMPIAKSHIEAGTFVLDGKIVMAGGQVDNFQPTANVIAYDPATNSWTTLAPLPVARQGAVIRAVGNAVYMTLGGTQTNSPQSGTWVGQLPALATPSTGMFAPTSLTSSPNTSSTRMIGLRSQSASDLVDSAVDRNWLERKASGPLW